MSTHELDSIDYELDSVDYASIIAGRWRCDVCWDDFMWNQTRWRLDEYGANCCHTFCRDCAVKCFQWGGKCPIDGTEFPQLMVCGIMTTAQYVNELKRKEATRTCGVMCCNPDCHGVAPAAEGKQPRQVRCPECRAQHCGRRVCGAPWTAGHRCWDLVEEDRRREEEAQRRREEERQRRTGAPRSVDRTRSLLKAAPSYRACPSCGVMVERDGGCNMVYHDLCKTRWCFACGSMGMGCRDFDCRGSSDTPSRTSVVNEGLQTSTAEVRCPESSGAPWTAGHRRWDLVEEDRRHEEEAQRRREEERQRRTEAPRSVDRTLSLLRAAPRCQACPSCGVMVERDGGSNMVYHDLCKTRWCFACGGMGMGCREFDCRGSSATPSRTSFVNEGLQAGPAEPRGASQGARRARGASRGARRGCLMRTVFALVGRLCCSGV